MPEYICPDCNGGFPEPSKTKDECICPWCKYPFEALSPDILSMRRLIK